MVRIDLLAPGTIKVVVAMRCNMEINRKGEKSREVKVGKQAEIMA